MKTKLILSGLAGLLLLSFVGLAVVHKKNTGSVTTTQAHTTSHIEPYQEIVALRNAKQNTKAKEKAAQYLQKNPNDVDTILILGTVYYQEKDYANAEKLFRKTLLINPRYLDAYLLLINTALATHNDTAAHEVAKQGLIYFPKNQKLKSIGDEILPKNNVKKKILSSTSQIKKQVSHKKPTIFLAKKRPILVIEKKPACITTEFSRIHSLAEQLTEQAIDYDQNLRRYQAARMGKLALFYDPKNKKALNLLDHLNGINPKYAIGVNEVGFFTGNDWVSDLAQDWNYSTLYYSRNTLYGQVIGKINYASRLDKTAPQAELELIPILNKNFSLDIDLTKANQPNLFPNYSLSAEGYFYFPKFIDFSFGEKYNNLGRPFFRVYTGSVAKDVKNNWLCFRPYHYLPKTGASSTFYTATIRHYFDTTDYFINLTLGYGRSPDLNNLQLVDFFVIDNRTVYLSLQIPLLRHKMALTLGVDYQRQIFPTGLVRNLGGGLIGLGWRF